MSQSVSWEFCGVFCHLVDQNNLDANDRNWDVQYEPQNDSCSVRVLRLGKVVDAIFFLSEDFVVDKGKLNKQTNKRAKKNVNEQKKKSLQLN